MLRRAFLATTGGILAPLVVANSVEPLSEATQLEVLRITLEKLQIIKPDSVEQLSVLKGDPDTLRLVGIKSAPSDPRYNLKFEYPTELKFEKVFTKISDAYDMLMEGKYHIKTRPEMMNLSVEFVKVNG